jgi:hypothetical protein
MNRNKINIESGKYGDVCRLCLDAGIFSSQHKKEDIKEKISN